MTILHLIHVLSILSLFCYSNIANATDRHLLSAPYFLSGDAYFHTAISEKVLKELDNDPDYPVSYRLWWYKSSYSRGADSVMWLAGDALRIVEISFQDGIHWQSKTHLLNLRVRKEKTIHSNDCRKPPLGKG